MRLKRVAAAVLAALLASCSSSLADQKRAALYEAKVHFESVMAVTDRAEEEIRVLLEMRDSHDPKGVAAIERITEALRYVKRRAADPRVVLPTPLAALALLVKEKAEAVSETWNLLVPRLERALAEGIPPDRVEEMQALYSAQDAYLRTLQFALNEVDRQLCEGSGGNWHREALVCT